MSDDKRGESMCKSRLDGQRRAQTPHSFSSGRDLIPPTVRVNLYEIVQFDPDGGTLVHLCVAIFVEPQSNTGSGVWLFDCWWLSLDRRYLGLDGGLDLILLVVRVQWITSLQSLSLCQNRKERLRSNLQIQGSSSHRAPSDFCEEWS